MPNKLEFKEGDSNLLSSLQSGIGTNFDSLLVAGDDWD